MFGKDGPRALFKEPLVRQRYRRTQLRAHFVHPLHPLVLLAIPKNDSTRLKHAFLNSVTGVHEPLAAPVYRAVDPYSATQAGLTAVTKRYEHVAILRHPRDRLISGFLGKFGRLRKPSRAVRTFLEQACLGDNVDSLTFRTFLAALCKIDLRALDGHWMPQSRFLLRNRSYRFTTVKAWPQMPQLHQAGLSLVGVAVDTRLPKTRIIPGAADMSVRDLRLLLRRDGQIPTTGSFFDGGLEDYFLSLFSDDLDLYDRVAAESP